MKHDIPTITFHGLFAPEESLNMGNSADLNGDGLSDIVFISGSFPPNTPIASRPVILINQGNGNYAPLDMPDNISGLVHPREIEFGDFNGDGISDIMIVGHGYDTDPFPGETNLLLLSDGNGGYTDASGNLPQVNDFSHSLTTSDIDGDGDLDIYVGNVFGGTQTPAYLLLNDGDGNFTQQQLDPTYFHPENAQNTSSHFADLDGDGVDELILGSTNHAPTRIFSYSAQQGGFVLQEEFAEGVFGTATISNDVKSADLNNDGLMDIVLAQTDVGDTTAGFQVMIQNGDGSFSDQTSGFMNGVATGNQWVEFFEFYDINNDGLMDIITNRSTPGDPIAYLNTGGQFVAVEGNFVVGNSEYFYVNVDAETGTVHGIKFYDGILEVAEIPLSHYGADISVENLTGISANGTSGADRLSGAAARDTLHGQRGNDVIEGHGGRDILYGESGRDTLSGGSSHDRLYGGYGHDTLYGNSGYDKLFGGYGYDKLYGGYGNDRLFGGFGNDSLYGGAGHDKLYGGSQHDYLSGGSGNDTLVGAGGDDQLRGGSGNDALYGGSGTDVLTGGYGRDVFVFRRNDANDTITDFTLGVDQIQIKSGASSLQELSFEQDGANVIVSFAATEITLQDMTVADIQNADHFLF